MKLRNKKTGEIKECVVVLIDSDGCPNEFQEFEKSNSLAEMNEKWEDYEEPIEYWYIYGNQVLKNECDGVMEDCFKEIGNYFSSREEAEKAVKKLKAWKRLKDKKFKLTEWYKPDGCEPFIVVETNIDYDDVDNKELQKDLDLLFSGEEE